MAALKDNEIPWIVSDPISWLKTVRSHKKDKIGMRREALRKTCGAIDIPKGKFT